MFGLFFLYLKIGIVILKDSKNSKRLTNVFEQTEKDTHKGKLGNVIPG